MYKNIDYYNNKAYTNLTNKVYDILEEAIVTLELKPGQVCSETELSQFTGIGRTPVREALKKLEMAALIEIIPRHGINISKIRLEDCYQQLEVRTLLEPLIITRATKFSSPSDREHFLDLARRYKEANDAQDALSAIRIDHEFNLFVANCARNSFAKTAIMPLQSLARRLYYMQYYYNKEATLEINTTHWELMLKIASGDEKAVLKSLENLFNNIQVLSTTITDTIVLENKFSQNLYF